MQVSNRRKIDAGRVREHPRQPLSGISVVRRRRWPHGHTGSDGRCIEQEPPSVRRNSHRLERCHEAVELGTCRDDTRPQLRTGCIDQHEQREVVAWPMRPGLSLADHPDQADPRGQLPSDRVGVTPQLIRKPQHGPAAILP